MTPPPTSVDVEVDEQTLAHLQENNAELGTMGGETKAKWEQWALLAFIVSCVGVVVILLVLDVRLALAAFAVLPVLVAVTVWFQRGSRRSYLGPATRSRRVNAELQESVAGVRVTQSLGREDNNAERFAAPLAAATATPACGRCS